MVSVSIIVPARNEAGTIQKIADELPSLGSTTEIVFVEGNSRDNTWEEIRHVAATYRGPHTIRFAQQPGRGKYDAVRAGFAMATGDILMIYDGDMSVPPSELPLFYTLLDSDKARFANGSRFVYGQEHGAMRFFNNLGNRFFTAAVSLVLGQRLTDTLCGTKVLWRKDYEKMRKLRSFLGPRDPFGDFDLLLNAAMLKLTIAEVPIHYKERIYGTTNINRWRDGLRLLKLTLLMLWYRITTRLTPFDTY